MPVGSGPAPARSEERRRENAPTGPFTKPEDVQMLAAGVDMLPTPPPPGEKWHPSALAMYESLRRSPGVIFMYAADWELAWQICEQLSQNLKPQFVGMVDRWNSDAEQMEHIPSMQVIPIKGATMSAIFRELHSIGLTEEGRRRQGFEAPPLKVGPGYETPEDDENDGVVASLDEARRRGLTA